MRRHGYVRSRGFVEKAHDIVAVSAIVDSGDPRWIGRGGKGNRREQDQRQNDRKSGKDRLPHRTGWLRRWRLLPRVKAGAHPEPPMRRATSCGMCRDPNRVRHRCQEEADRKHISWKPGGIRRVPGVGRSTTSETRSSCYDPGPCPGLDQGGRHACPALPCPRPGCGRDYPIRRYRYAETLGQIGWPLYRVARFTSACGDGRYGRPGGGSGPIHCTGVTQA